jgi:hypothetical protein
LLEQGERPIGLPNEEIERLSRACNQLGFTTTSSFSIDQHKDLRGFPRNRTCPLADAFVTVNRYPWIQVGGSFCPDGYCSRIVLLGIDRNESSHTTATSCIIGIVHQRKNTNDAARLVNSSMHSSIPRLSPLQLSFHLVMQLDRLDLLVKSRHSI